MKNLKQKKRETSMKDVNQIYFNLPLSKDFFQFTVQKIMEMKLFTMKLNSKT